MYNRNSNEIWQEIKENLKQELDQDVYETYFADINEVYKENESIIYLTVENAFIKNRVQATYLSKMNSFLSSYYSTPKRFLLITKEEIVEAEEKKKEQESELDFTKINASGLSSNNTFNNFIVGDSNRFAYRSAMIAAEQMAQFANPVYIFGDVGLGKTHLMQAIGNYILENKQNQKVLYIKTQNFVEDYVKAGRANEYDVFSEQFNDIDVLLVDDIQFLESKTQCQLEFFKIFERLSDGNKLIVLTSDRKASDLQIMARLTSRFSYGISIDIGKPEKSLRIGILNSKIKQSMPNPEVIPEEVVDYIASVCQTSIRELEGALKRVLFYCDAFGTGYTLESAKESLKSLISFSNSAETTKSPSQDIKKMLDVVSNYFQVSMDDLLSNSRKKDIVYARQICWYLLRDKYDVTYTKIGEIFNGKDHSTIMHGCDVFEAELNTNPDAKKNVENILRKMGKSSNEI